MLKLNMATIYYPYFGKLLNGSYTAHDVELSWQYVTPPDKLFREVIESSAYDVAEMSMSGYTMLRDKGWREYVALPIFTSRRFRHSALFVRSDSNIVSGEQLAGKNVGLPEYHMTAAVWVRGILEEDFGVKPEQIHWFTGGAERPGRKERVKLPPEIKAEITAIPTNETLFNMLLDRRLDAVMCAHKPELARGRDARVRALFPNPPQVERDYYTKHGIFPIMHTLLLREALLAKENNIAHRIHLILEELKEEFYATVEILRHHPVFPWFEDYIDEIEDLMGKDPWAHGITQNARALNKFLDYSYSQGLLRKKPPLNELFVALSN
ncbi:MAG: PhnD/SsuA/transferrin family substrate-binding protein [Candidatus Binatia bacterium]